MAIKKEEVKKILEADASNPEVIYMLGENYIFDKEIYYTQKLAGEGKFGPIVYAESEYVNDVSYRWRGNTSDYKNTPVKEGWYSLFDPLMYAHAILPGQIAMGGYNNPVQFSEVMSYASDIGGDEGKPVCAPAKAFHVALFKTPEGAICKCLSAYVIALKNRKIIQVVGRLGSYVSFKGTEFFADGHNIKGHNRVGKKKKVPAKKIMKMMKSDGWSMLNSTSSMMSEFVNAITDKRAPITHSKIAANATYSGIAASESARKGTSVSIEVLNF